MINSLSNVFSYLGPIAVGYAKDATGKFEADIYVLAGTAPVAMLAALGYGLWLPRGVVRERWTSRAIFECRCVTVTVGRQGRTARFGAVGGSPRPTLILAAAFFQHGESTEGTVHTEAACLPDCLTLRSLRIPGTPVFQIPAARSHDIRRRTHRRDARNALTRSPLRLNQAEIDVAMTARCCRVMFRCITGLPNAPSLPCQE